MPYGLYRRDVLRILKFGQPLHLSEQAAFWSIISEQYDEIASTFGCEVELSSIKLLEAQKYWIHDLEHIAVDESEEPDHFKHAGWLCHWLRKKMPASKIIIHDETKLTNTFEEYYSEVIAFTIGFRLVLFHECCARGYDDSMIVNTLNNYSTLSPLHDFLVYLSHKNVSPHAIYLIYKSLVAPSPFEGPM